MPKATPVPERVTRGGEGQHSATTKGRQSAQSLWQLGDISTASSLNVEQRETGGR